LSADVKFSRKFWFLAPTSRGGQMLVLPHWRMPILVIERFCVEGSNTRGDRGEL